jgi:hypothetical protein
VVEIPKMEWENYDAEDSQKYIGAVSPIKREEFQNRAHKVLEKLRLEHLNPEERQMLENTCKDYQDIFYLPGDRLSCTTTVKHSINVMPGTSPINTRPYRLPETQRTEIDKQVDKLLKEEIITESNSKFSENLYINNLAYSSLTA